MHKMTANPMVIRLALWLVATLAALAVFLLYRGGLDSLLESINDFF